MRVAVTVQCNQWAMLSLSPYGLAILQRRGPVLGVFTSMGHETGCSETWPRDRIIVVHHALVGGLSACTIAAPQDSLLLISQPSLLLLRVRSKDCDALAMAAGCDWPGTGFPTLCAEQHTSRSSALPDMVEVLYASLQRCLQT